MPNDRGAIINRNRAKQLRDFSGLRFGTITPTDIDGLIEYHNQAYVLIETKYGKAPMPYGQRLALERLTDDLEKSGKPTLCIISSHLEHNYEKDIDTAHTQVTEYRLKKEWITIDTDLKITVRKLIELFWELEINVPSEDLHYYSDPEPQTYTNYPLSDFLKLDRSGGV